MFVKTPSCPKERQLGPMPSGPLSPTSARGSSGASANGTGSRSLHARVAELNKKMEEIFKSSKTPKFQEILFFWGGERIYFFGRRSWENMRMLRMLDVCVGGYLFWSRR